MYRKQYEQAAMLSRNPDKPLTEAGWFDSVGAAFSSFVAEDSSMSEEWSQAQQVDDALNKIYKFTGFEEYNPAGLEDVGYVSEEMQVDTDVSTKGLRGYRQKKEILRQASIDPEVQAFLKANYGDVAPWQSAEEIEQSAADNARRLRENRERMALNQSFMGKVGDFTGTMAGAMTDPWNLSTIMVGAPAAVNAGRTILSSALRVAAVEGAVGAATEALIQPTVYGYKQQIDSPYSVQEAIFNITAAGVGGALFGGLIYGGREVFNRKLLGDYEKAKADGRITPDRDSEAAADVLREVTDLMDTSGLVDTSVGRGAHLRALDQAWSDIQKGKPVRVENITEQNFSAKIENANQEAIVKAYDDLRNGRGDPVAIAKAMRQAGAVPRVQTPMGFMVAPELRLADGISRLDSKIEVNNPMYGATVGRNIQDPEIQAKAVAELDKHKPVTEMETEFMSNQVGKGDMKLLKEKSTLMERAMEILMNDRDMLPLMSGREFDLDGLHNQMGIDSAAARVNPVQHAMATFQSDLHGNSFLNGKLNEIAQSVADGGNLAERAGVLANTYRKQFLKKQRVLDNEQAKRTTPKKGKPINTKKLSEKDRKKAEDDMIFSQPHTDVHEAHKVALLDQEVLVEFGGRMQAELGEDIYFANPRAKKLDTTIQRMQDKGHTDARKMKDIVRAGFITENHEDAIKIIKKMSREFELLDEDIAANPHSYYWDHKLMVKFPNGSVGEVQFWHPQLLIAKEGRFEFDKKTGEWKKNWIPDKFFEGRWVPEKEVSGHKLYEDSRAISGRLKNEKDMDLTTRGELEAEKARLDQASMDLYSRAGQDANTSWKASLESEIPSITSSGKTPIQVEPVSAKAVAATDLSTTPRTQMAGHESIDQYDKISSSTAGNGGMDMDASLKANIDRILAENPDFEIPIAIVDGKPQMMKVSDLMKQNSDTLATIDKAITCMT